MERGLLQGRKTQNSKACQGVESRLIRDIIEFILVWLEKPSVTRKVSAVIINKHAVSKDRAICFAHRGRDSSPPSTINTGEAVPVTIIAWTGSSKTMLHFQLRTILLLATICLFQTTVSLETVITCDNGSNVQRLRCDTGVVRVDAALYGRLNQETCSAGRPPQQLVDTSCSQKGTVNVMKNRCNGKKVCEINTNFVRTSDPCLGIYKYLETNYTCVPAIRVVACEGSSARLFCDVGQVIFVIGADYGRHDQTTCSYKRPESQFRNVDCSRPTSKVADSCNGKNSCTVHASNQVFGEPCGDTYKYLGVAYVCEYPE